jgi:phosphopantothenoylcysteine decarboxylase/phosphopantothenate--cysteine ligase
MDVKSQRLSGKKIALCITGSVAAVECVKLARELGRSGADVSSYMTGSAQAILHPNAMEFATKKKPVLSLSGLVEHLATFDLVIVAPATANTIAKIAHGISDSVVTSLMLASKCPVIIAPAMHNEMYSNPFFQNNLKALKNRFIITGPVFEEGAVKMVPIEEIVDTAYYALEKKDLAGKKVLITAGPTMEPIDPVRVITNRSSGKMGVTLAREAMFRGADVTLIMGPGYEPPPNGVEVIKVETGAEMADAVSDQKEYDIFIGVAAVSDFTVEADQAKIDSRNGAIDLHLEVAPKILSKIKKSAVKVGFKAEYKVSESELIESAKSILDEHNLDFVVANDVSKDIFGSEESEVILVEKKRVTRIERTGKIQISNKILDRLGEL